MGFTAKVKGLGLRSEKFMKFSSYKLYEGVDGVESKSVGVWAVR